MRVSCLFRLQVIILLQGLIIADIDLQPQYDGDINNLIRRGLSTAEMIYALGHAVSWELQNVTDSNSTSHDPLFLPTHTNSLPYTDVQKILCLQDVLAYVRGVDIGSPWAVSMLDATANPGPGLQTGRLTFMGDFDQCRSVVANYVNTEGQRRQFEGQYCNVHFELTYPAKLGSLLPIWGFCLPDSCSNQIVLETVSNGLEYLGIYQFILHSANCIIETHLPAKAIGTICVISVVLTLVALGTVLDLFFVYRLGTREKQEQNSKVSSVSFRPSNGDGDSVFIFTNTDVSQCAAVKEIEMSRDISLTSANINENKLYLLLRSFSAWTNGKMILDTHIEKRDLTCVNGIRVFSFLWIALGHVFIMPATNFSSYLHGHFERFEFQLIHNFTLAADSFFVLSGLLMANSLLKDLGLNKGKKNWISFFVHRYVRLTPLYAIVLAFYATLLPYLHTGPLWNYWTADVQPCEDEWWANLLYVHNLLRTKDKCMIWAWYLAVDMQFYVISPLILVPLYYKPVLGYVSAAIFFLATTVTSWVLTATHDFGTDVVANVEDGENRVYLYYVAPYCRMGPYIVGLLLGHIIRRTDRNLKIPRSLNLLGWIVATAVSLAILFGQYGHVSSGYIEKLTTQVASAYNALSRSVWGLCLAWVILSCATGHGGAINSFLSWRLFVPLSRLCYSAYLIHPILMGVIILSSETGYFLTDVSYITIYVSAVFFSFVFSFFASLCFEMPPLRIEKIVLQHKKVER